MCEPITLGLAAGALTGGAAATVGGAGLLLSSSLGLAAASGVMSAASAYQQGQVQKQVGRNNAVMAEYAAQDAVRRGEDQAIQARRKGDQIKGAARASMAAKGLDLSSGTAAELQDQTDFFSESDQNTARFNAQRDAWSSRAAGEQYRAQGNAAATQSSLQAFGTVLGTGAQVAGRWSDFTAPKKGP